MTKSPLRYPGGKTRAISILNTYVKEYYPDRNILISPFLGGGSFELHCASNGYNVLANDLFHPLYVFWSVLKHNPSDLESSVRNACPVTKDAFLRFRTTIRSLQTPLDIATAYFIVNRCSFSGATFCGGFSQQAADGRMNESAIQRLRQVDMMNITLSNEDAIEFLMKHPETSQTVIYADPPYYIDTYIYGKDGDLHEGFNHDKFAEYIRTRNDWILSYNDCPKIRQLYDGCRFFTEKWSYGMNASKSSNEVIILPPS